MLEVAAAVRQASLPSVFAETPTVRSDLMRETTRLFDEV
jgi:hypothetical protein